MGGLPALQQGLFLFFQIVELPQLLGGIDPRLGFVGVVQEGEQPVVLGVGDRVELVGMTLGALDGQPEHRLANAVEAIEHLRHAELLGHDGPFFVDHAVAEEAGGDQLILRGMGQEVAGDLLDQELVVGHVGVVSPHDPIAPDPLLAGQVFLVAVGVGVTGGVEPVPGPFFTIALARQQLLQGGSKPIPLEFGQLFGAGRKTNHIEVETPAEGRVVGGRRGLQSTLTQSRADEGVDGVRGPLGDERLLDRLKRPMPSIVSPLLHPAAQQLDLGGSERILLGRGRHHLAGIGGGDPADQLTGGRLPCHNGGLS